MVLAGEIKNNYNLEKLLSVINECDIYKFVASSPESSQKDSKYGFGFSHYLIQQAIKSTILPQKLNELHAHFASIYEMSINSNDLWKTTTLWQCPYLNNLIFHLVVLPGEYERKWKYLFAAFEGAAETGRYVEGMYFSKLLLDTINGIKNENKWGLFERYNYHKNMAKLLYENG